MKAVNKRRKNWKIVKTPTRVTSTFDTLLGGLQLTVNPELIDLKCVARVDGFILYSGLFRKDWALTAYTTAVVENLETVTAVSCLPCSES